MARVLAAVAVVIARIVSREPEELSRSCARGETLLDRLVPA